MEQVTIFDPTSGNYTAEVSGFNIPIGPQKYYILYEFISDEIIVTYPMGGEGLIPYIAEFIQWDAYGSQGYFNVEYSVNNGVSWSTIGNQVNGSSRIKQWPIPNSVSGEVLIRVSRDGISGQSSDVFSIISDESHGYINYLQVSFGAIVRSHTIEIKKKLDEKNVSLLQLGIIEIRQLFSSISKTLFLSHKVSLGEELKVFVPQQGDKKKLVDLSIRNAKYFRIDRYKQMKITDPDRHTKRIMSQMKVDLRLPKEPIHIECFDNSNIQGSNPVAACIVFKNGKPSKKEYRHYNIKTVNGPDDFASMEEVVFRRYKRLLEEDASLPQLIVIDGGKGQLSSAVKSLDILGLRGKISILGIAKRLEEIYFPNDSIPLYLDKKSESLKILQRARDEAHRFGIIFHRQKRNKSSLTSKLDVIPGIGPATREKLLSSLKSFKRIKSASKREVINILGKEKGAKIYEALQKN